jgi:hypothetical protein
VAGFIQGFTNGFTFATVHGAGHEVRACVRACVRECERVNMDWIMTEWSDRQHRACRGTLLLSLV